jgi:hypothetical protein
LLLTRYKQEGETFLKDMIMRNESYMHFFTPKNRHVTSEWQHQNAPWPKKIHLEAFSRKGSLTVFIWDHKGMILEHYLEQIQRIKQ